MATINWYDVLLVEPDCTPTDIKNSYRDLVKTYHPDKRDGDAEMFELITHAYNVLINPHTRASYDKLYNVSKQSESSHHDLKSKSDQYFKSLEGSNVKKTKEEVDIDFDTIFSEMDKKYGLKRDGNKKLVQKDDGDVNKKVKDLEFIREHDDIENVPDKLFDNTEKIDMDKFNSMFDAMHKKQTDLIKHEGNPIAWNTANESNAFSTLDNYDCLFVEDDDLGNSVFGSVKIGDNNKPKKMTRKDLERHTKDYVKPSYRDDNTAKTLQDKINERNNQTLKYEQRTMNDFNDDNDCGGYGIFKNLDINFEDLTDDTFADDNKDLKARYTKLLDSRR